MFFCALTVAHISLENPNLEVEARMPDSQPGSIELWNRILEGHLLARVWYLEHLCGESLRHTNDNVGQEAVFCMSLGHFSLAWTRFITSTSSNHRRNENPGLPRFVFSMHCEPLYYFSKMYSTICVSKLSKTVSYDWRSFEVVFCTPEPLTRILTLKQETLQSHI